MSGAERLRRLRRIGLHETGIAVRQVYRKEVDLPFHPADHRKRFAEVRLRVPDHAAMGQTPAPPPLRQHVVLHDRQAAGIAVLVAQALEASASMCAAASPAGPYPLPGSGRSSPRTDPA